MVSTNVQSANESRLVSQVKLVQKSLCSCFIGEGNMWRCRRYKLSNVSHSFVDP